jgi:hypothetical protein
MHFFVEYESLIQTLVVLSQMLQLLDASISGFIDLCNAVYHKVMAENMMRLAQDILDTCCVNAAHYCTASCH